MSECGVMYLGTVGTCITSLQTWMNWAVGTKATAIEIDGVYGKQTQALVQTFQRRYVSAVTPNGMFGAKSRAALKRWFEAGKTREHGSGLPCNTALGWGCDKGAVKEGVNAGLAGTIICAAVGAPFGPHASAAAGVFCDITLD
ncbi:peptidoglycan-binding domain-containing protein [Streptomyces europaeiscabiei]|uniref:peptidoglycan-binding domain-containing protein n=1 Tax=Streptomyces europaeiscabiei TaxID=146819 RepID=UPI000E692DBE|nr:peptidoglycan-binding protein [Streptomyces europaeiscabiei]